MAHPSTKLFFINESHNTVRYNVQQHANLIETEFFNDFNASLSAEKSNNTCNVWKISGDEPKPFQVKSAVNKYFGKFPSNKYLVERKKVLPLYEADISTLPVTIRNFCGSAKIFNAVVFNTLAEMEIFYRNASKSVIGKRNINFQKIASCSNQVRIRKTLQKDAQKCANVLKERNCQFNNRTCVWLVKCKKFPSDTEWYCQWPSHISYLKFCCDYKCKD